MQSGLVHLSILHKTSWNHNFHGENYDKHWWYWWTFISHNWNFLPLRQCFGALDIFHRRAWCIVPNLGMLQLLRHSLNNQKLFGFRSSRETAAHWPHWWTVQLSHGVATKKIQQEAALRYSWAIHSINSYHITWQPHGVCRSLGTRNFKSFGALLCTLSDLMSDAAFPGVYFVAFI